jgi:hypothetical protein
MTARRISDDERRARLVRRHHLAPAHRAADPVEVARGLVALHATDPASVYLSTAARLAEPDKAVADLEGALYEDRTLVRMLGMRRTVFVVPREQAAVVHAACTRAIAVQQRKLLVQHLVEGGVEAARADPAGWLADVEESTLRALAARGTATGQELSQDEPRLREQITLNVGKNYGGATNITSRVLFLLAADGRIVRGRPRGSWISSQYRWSTVDSWLPGGMPDLDTGAARAALVRDWLAAYGPGTVADLKWWTGWTAGEVKRALAAIGPVEVDLDGTTGLVLPGDEAPVAPAEPHVALLPALDPTVMGWTGRDWFLGRHAPALFDRSGNPGPTVWWDGRVVGGWAQRAGGEVVFRLLEDVGTDVSRTVDAEAARLADRLGAVRVTPRFRTPLERQLVE